MAAVNSLAQWNAAVAASNRQLAAWNPIGQMPASAQAAAAAAAAKATKAAQTKAAPKIEAARKTRYATLRAIDYPPPPPVFVQVITDAAQRAANAAQRAQAAKTQADAEVAAQQAAVAAAAAISKAEGASEDPAVQAATKQAQGAIGTAAKAVAVWTKQDAAKLAPALISQGNAVARADTEKSAAIRQDILAESAAELPPAPLKLDWRFWVGMGAGAVGIWLILRKR